MFGAAFLHDSTFRFKRRLHLHVWVHLDHAQVQLHYGQGFADEGFQIGILGHLFMGQHGFGAGIGGSRVGDHGSVVGGGGFGSRVAGIAARGKGEQAGGEQRKKGIF